MLLKEGDRTHMRLVLATPPADGVMDQVGAPPPLGLLHVATSVSNSPNVTVHIVDGTVTGLTVDEAAEQILALDPDLLGLSVLSTNIQRGMRLIKRVKELRKSLTTVVGGIHATLFDHLILKEIPEVDMAMRGESEHSFPEFCASLMQGQDITRVPGLSYRSKGEIVRGTPQLVENLEELPFVDWDTVEKGSYYRSWGPIPLPRDLKAAGILSSRGCPYLCSFCSKVAAGEKWRPRSAQNVLEELVQISRQGFDYVFFHDDNFTRSPKRVTELCEMLLEAKLGLRFWFEGSLHHLPQSTLDLMNQAGFDCVAVGVESGSDEQLKRFNKPGNSRTVASGVLRAKKAHMVVHAFFITGGPGETAEDHNASKDFIQRVKPHSVGAAILNIYPGSEIWNQLKGLDDPRTVADSGACAIYECKDQPSKETLSHRCYDLYRALARSWVSRERIAEVGDLVRNNVFVKMCLHKGVRRLPNVFRAVWAFVRAPKRGAFDPEQWSSWKRPG